MKRPQDFRTRAPSWCWVATIAFAVIVLPGARLTVQGFGVASSANTAPETVEGSYEGKPTSYWVQELGKDDKTARQAAVTALRVIGLEGLSGLTKALKDEDSEIRQSAAAALGEIGKQLDLTATTSSQRSHYVTLDVKDKDLNNVLELLSRHAGVKIVADVNVKETVTVSLDTVEWQNAVKVVAGRANCEIVRQSDRLIRLTQDPKLRAVVLTLAKALKDQEVSVRISAAQALLTFDRPARAAVPALVGALKDENPQVRRRAGLALGEIFGQVKSKSQDPTKGSPYISLDVKDKNLDQILRFISRRVGVNVIADPDVKDTVTIQLDSLDWRDALEVIAENTDCQLVFESDRLIRFTQYPSFKVAMAAISDALNDKEKEVRSAAAQALGRIGLNARTAVPALVTALEDDNKEVRERAAEALERIRGRNQ